MSEREEKVFEALEKRFPNISPGELKEKSCAIAKEGQEEVWKGIVSKLAEENKNEDPRAVFKRFRLKLNPKMLDNNKEEIHMEHFYVAAFHFHKMALKWAVDDFAPLPLRTLSKPEDAIDYAKLWKNGLKHKHPATDLGFVILLQRTTPNRFFKELFLNKGRGSRIQKSYM